MNRISLGGGAFRTTLLMSGDTPWRTEQLAATVSYERRLNAKWTLSFSGGGVLGGRMVRGDQTYAIGGGGVLGVSASVVALDQGTYTPFLIISGSLSGSVAQAQPTLYGAADLRVAVSAGYTFFGHVTPYAVGRLFGGPVFWNNSVGGDATHVQLGGGVAATLPLGLDVYVEAIPLGEQRLSAGLGLSF